MLIAQRPTLTEETVDEFRSRFVIEPLEPGFDPHAALAAYGDDDDDAFIEDEQL